VFGFVLCLATGLLFVTGIYANINIHPYVVLKSDVFLQLKLGFVMLAGINLLAFYVTGMSRTVDRLEAGDDAPPLAKVFAGASLCIWIAVMYFARLILRQVSVETERNTRCAKGVPESIENSGLPRIRGP
jgi:hypothetical protein